MYASNEQELCPKKAAGVLRMRLLRFRFLESSSSIIGRFDGRIWDRDREWVGGNYSEGRAGI